LKGRRQTYEKIEEKEETRKIMAIGRTKGGNGRRIHEKGGRR
jgi:hypothetical protein